MKPAAAPSGLLDPLAPFSLRNKIVVLTGASSGLGQRFARVVDALGETHAGSSMTGQTLVIDGGVSC